MNRLFRQCLLFFIGISLCCCGTRDPQEPTLIYVPENLPPIAELLNRVGEDSVDPILAQGEDFEVRRSDLVRFLVNLYGKDSLAQLVQREVAIRYIRRSGIKISADEIESRAQKILDTKQMTLTQYLDSRGIDRVTWVNEISVLIGIEFLCRNEVVKQGAVFVRYTMYSSLDGAKSGGVDASSVPEWISPFMIDNPKLVEILFSEHPPAHFYDGVNYWAIEVLDRIQKTRSGNQFFEKRSKKVANWIPTEQRLEQFLNYLLNLQEVEYIQDRLHYELKKKSAP